MLDQGKMYDSIYYYLWTAFCDYAVKCGVKPDGGWNSKRIQENFPNVEILFTNKI